MRGVLALVPAGDLPDVHHRNRHDAGRLGGALIAAQGLHAGSSDFAPNTYLLPAALRDLARVNKECATATIARYRARPQTSVIRQLSEPGSRLPRSARTQLARRHRPARPVLILQGGRDAVVPVSAGARLHSDYCALDATVTRVVYPRANHRSVIKAAQTDASEVDRQPLSEPARVRRTASSSRPLHERRRSSTVRPRCRSGSMPTCASSGPATPDSRRPAGCSQAGKSVVVLEARDRVGGRIWTQHSPTARPIDRGGAWLGPRHDAMFASRAARWACPRTRRG